MTQPPSGDPYQQTAYIPYGQQNYSGTPAIPHIPLARLVMSMILFSPVGFVALIRTIFTVAYWSKDDTARANENAEAARRLSTIGTIIGAVGIGLFFLFYILMIIVAISAGASGSSY